MGVSGYSSADLDVLDIYDVFSAYDPTKLKVSEDDGHPSPLEQRIVAEAILAKQYFDYADIFRSERSMQDHSRVCVVHRTNIGDPRE